MQGVPTLSRGTVNSGGRCLLPAPAQLVPQKAGNDALSGSVSWATGCVLRVTCRAWLGLCRVHQLSCQVRPHTIAVGVGRRRRHRRHQRRLKGDDTAAATSVATDSHGSSTGATQMVADFTLVTAGTKARHDGLTNMTDMVEPAPLTLMLYPSAM